MLQPEVIAGPCTVFLLPFAGGGASFYRDWRDQGPLRFRPLQLPGREGRLRQPRARRMEDLLDGLVADLLPGLDGPYVLFGHSMGAGIAHALARRLTEAGYPPPRLLAVSARRPPDVAQARPRAQLPDAELKAELAELGGTPPGVLDHPELAEILLPILRDDLALDEAYLSAAPAPCPVLAFSGVDDHLAPPSLVAGWARTAPAGFRHTVVPGDHFHLADPDGRQQVMEALGAATPR